MTGGGRWCPAVPGLVHAAPTTDHWNCLDNTKAAIILLRAGLSRPGRRKAAKPRKE